MRYEEYQLSTRIGKYLSLYRKDLLFQFSNDAIKLNKVQAGRRKALCQRRGYPDLFIMEPTKKYCGLYVELKRDKDAVYTKKGEMRKNKHLLEQIEMLENLKKRGYQAVFCWSIVDFIKILDDYLEGK